jgi:hypothetical protein
MEPSIAPLTFSMTGGFGAVAATTAKEAAVARSPKVMGEATMMSEMRVWGRKDSS